MLILIDEVESLAAARKAAANGTEPSDAIRVVNGRWGLDGLGWDGMGWDGMGWVGMGWDGMGWTVLQG